MPLEVGLTGSIGAGKSTVARLLQALGAALIDADALAREAALDEGVRQQVAATFGEDVLHKRGFVRARLAERAFKDDASREALNAIIHPYVARARQKAVRELAESHPVIVHDIPLLFETGLDAEMDAIVVVVAPYSVRLARLMQRNPELTALQIKARDAAQLPQSKKRLLADYVIENNSGEEALRRNVQGVWQALLEKAQHKALQSEQGAP